MNGDYGAQGVKGKAMVMRRVDREEGWNSGGGGGDSGDGGKTRRSNSSDACVESKRGREFRHRLTK